MGSDLRARYYNPNTGRFMSRDPNSPSILDSNYSPTDPKDLHRYLYANGDPINGIDPTGRATMAELTARMGRIITAAVAFANAAFQCLKLYNQIDYDFGLCQGRKTDHPNRKRGSKRWIRRGHPTPKNRSSAARLNRQGLQSSRNRYDRQTPRSASFSAFSHDLVFADL